MKLRATILLLTSVLCPLTSVFAQSTFTVPLQPGTTLSNVRYEWIAAGVAGSAQSSGITQPDSNYPLFRISASAPSNAEELIVYDNTDSTNWNTGSYRIVANLDAAVSSRMATYTQPTGFLSATFPGGTIANTTNITAGTITTTTNLTNLPAITSNWLTASGVAAGALNGKGDWLLSSSYTAPDNTSAAAAASNTTNLPGLLENVSGYRFTTHALMQAPSGGGGGGTFDYDLMATTVWQFDLTGITPTGQKAENLLKRIGTKP